MNRLLFNGNTVCGVLQYSIRVRCCVVRRCFSWLVALDPGPAYCPSRAVVDEPTFAMLRAWML